MGMRKFSAADLFTHDGHSFLIVSPVGTVPGEGAYKGCAVFPFEDLATGAITRDRDGRPHLDVFVELDQDSFNGACAFLPDGPHRGLVIGQVDFTAHLDGIEPTFRIFATEVTPGSAGRQ